MRVRQLTGVDDAARGAALREAAELLRAGGLVAFPTETVYGLGAHALDVAAVQRIYEAKGRPAINPLIVHVANLDAARALAAEWPSAAERLGTAYWPGPITLVVRKTGRVPALVTAGQDTVGLRVPAHPIALDLLAEAGVPIAAPSANRSNQVSPTTAQHVVRGLGDRVELVLDGGSTTVGIESTVVDVTGEVPRILRPGMISRDDVAQVVGAADEADLRHAGAREPVRSPGLLGRHYAPRARLAVFERADRTRAIVGARAARSAGRRVGALVFTSLGLELPEERLMAADAAGYARALYATLHELDEAGCDVVFVELPPADAGWAGVRDRLQRAARAD